MNPHTIQRHGAAYSAGLEKVRQFFHETCTRENLGPGGAAVEDLEDALSYLSVGLDLARADHTRLLGRFAHQGVERACIDSLLRAEAELNASFRRIRSAIAPLIRAAKSGRAQYALEALQRVRSDVLLWIELLRTHEEDLHEFTSVEA